MALILDASHTLGIVPVQGHLADFTVSSCYKFALGIHEGSLHGTSRELETLYRSVLDGLPQLLEIKEMSFF